MSKIVYDKIETEKTAFGTTISCLLDDENIVQPILVADEDVGVWTDLLSDLTDLRDTTATLKVENARLKAENERNAMKIEKLSNENDNLLKNLSSINMSDKVESFKVGLSALLESVFGGDVVDESIDVSVLDIVDESVDVDDVRYVVNDEYLINFARAAKILGYSASEIDKLLGCDMKHVLNKHNFNWVGLASAKDIYYTRHIQKKPVFGGHNRISKELKKKGKHLIDSFEGPIRKMCKMGCSLEDIAKDTDISVAFLWAICYFKGIDFTLRKEGTTFNDNIVYVPFLSVGNIIHNAGGMEYLLSQMSEGKNQYDLAEELGVSQGSLSNYMKNHKYE